MASAKSKGGGVRTGTAGPRPVGTTDPAILDEHDFADELMGKNRLQGDDQHSVRNQRRTRAGALEDPRTKPKNPRQAEDGD